MKPIFCKECKWNKNGWCYKYECNGPKRVEVCPKYRDEDLKEGCEYCNVKYGKEKLITQGCYNNLYIDKDEYDNLHIIAKACLLYTSPSPRDGLLSRMPSSA